MSQQSAKWIRSDIIYLIPGSDHKCTWCSCIYDLMGFPVILKMLWVAFNLIVIDTIWSTEQTVRMTTVNIRCNWWYKYAWHRDASTGADVVLCPR